MDTIADANQFIVAYPQGIIAQGQGYDWNVPNVPLIGGRPVPPDSPDDVAFLSQTVAFIANHYCVNPHLVFATGFSGGARIASQLGCDLSTQIAAVAPVSGLRIPAPCGAPRAVPILAFHGSADPIDPYNGGGQPYWTYSVPQAARGWATHDHCLPTPTVTTPSFGAQLTTYNGCADGAVVRLYSLLGAGHRWPDGPPVPGSVSALLGPESKAVDANSVMWTFFQQHPLA